MSRHLRRRIASVAIARNTTGIATGVKVCTVPRGGVVLRAWFEVTTVFNAGTTNVVKMGVTGTLGKYLDTADIDETAVGASVAKGPFKAETAATPVLVSYVQTGTAATTGAGVAYVEYVS